MNKEKLIVKILKINNHPDFRNGLSLFFILFFVVAVIINSQVLHENFFNKSLFVVCYTFFAVTAYFIISRFSDLILYKIMLHINDDGDYTQKNIYKNIHTLSIMQNIYFQLIIDLYIHHLPELKNIKKNKVSQVIKNFEKHSFPSFVVNGNSHDYYITDVVKNHKIGYIYEYILLCCYYLNLYKLHMTLLQYLRIYNLEIDLESKVLLKKIIEDWNNLAIISKYVIHPTLNNPIFNLMTIVIHRYEKIILFKNEF